MIPSVSITIRKSHPLPTATSTRNYLISEEISSFAYCHIHKKLSDFRTLCEGCLLSVSTEKDSAYDKYKYLVGILDEDIDFFVEDNQKLLMNLGNGDDGKETADEKGSAHLCSCCGEALKPRSSSKYWPSLSMNAPAPSPRASLLVRRNKEGRSIMLPHVKYTELKFISDAEQELSEYEMLQMERIKRLCKVGFSAIATRFRGNNR